MRLHGRRRFVGEAQNPSHFQLFAWYRLGRSACGRPVRSGIRHRGVRRIPPIGTTESRTAPTGLLQAGFGRQADERQKTALAFWIENGVALRVFVPIAGERALLDDGFSLESDGQAPGGDPL